MDQPLIARVKMREVYGLPRYYPDNAVAQALATLSGTVTLDVRKMQAARLGLGVTFEVIGAALPKGDAEALGVSQ